MIAEPEQIKEDKPEIREDAVSPGDGVSRLRSVIHRRPKTVSMDGPKIWLDKPIKENQLENPELCRQTRIETIVFDLSKSSDLQAWNELQSSASGPLATVVLTYQQQFCEKLENWKIMAMVAHYKFLDILGGKGEPPESVKEQENGN